MAETAPDARRRASETERMLLNAEAVAAYLTKSLIHRSPVTLQAEFAGETMKIETAIRRALADLQALLSAPQEREAAPAPAALSPAVREAAEEYREDLDHQHHFDRQEDSGICTDRSHASGERLLAMLATMSRAPAMTPAILEAAERLRAVAKGEGAGSFYEAAMNLLDEIDAALSALDSNGGAR